MATEAGVDATAAPGTPQAPRSPGRAGRDLRAAIGVGVALGAIILVPLYTYRAAFAGVVAVAMVIGMVELVRALQVANLRPPLVPLVVGAAATIVTAYLGGPGALVVAVLVTAVAATGWRVCAGGSVARLLPDIASAVLATGYLPLLGGFAALLTAPHDGARRVTIFIATTVCSDVGGYATGVLVGRHPLAPTVSPKKSWEGLAGSLLACAVGGSVLTTTLLHAAWWQGALLGLAVACVATLGDLGESLLKRDIGVKDMGTLLPGHGGLMDRLDSLLAVAPIAFLLLRAFVPTGQ